MSNKAISDFPNPSFAAKRRGVALGMAGGAAASLSVFALATMTLPSPVGDSAAPGDRYTVLLPWLAVLALPLAGGVAAIAKHRFLHREAIDGGNDAADRDLAAKRAFLQNTTEQTLLAALAFLALTAILPTSWLAAPPVLVGWFILARVAFRIGYPAGAAARSFGFAATFYPSVAAILVAALLLFARFLY